MLESLVNTHATLLKETQTQVSSFEYCEICKNSFFTEHLRTTASALIHAQKIINYLLRCIYINVHLHYNFLVIFLIVGKSGFM